MAIRRQGVGAGGRDLADQPNVLRLIVGEALHPQPATLLLETNVDDMDPRLWPPVLTRLLEAGASDAWLTPIVMKKGRLAHPVRPRRRPRPRRGTARRLRRDDDDRFARDRRRQRALDRTERSVEVDGHRVRIKTATLDGLLVNGQPEYDDVVAAARAAGRPVKAVLAEAAAAARAAGLAP